MHPLNPTLPLSLPRPFLWPVGTCAHQEGLTPALGGTMWEALAQSSSGRKSSDTNGACLENRKVDRLHLTTTATRINAPTASLLSIVTPDRTLAINLLKQSTRLGKRAQYSAGRGWGLRRVAQPATAGLLQHTKPGAGVSHQAHLPPSASSPQPGPLRFRLGASLPTLAREHPSPLAKYF